MKIQVFTIGHSNHAIDYFVDLLRSRNIDALADVRSSPFSRLNPQFNKYDLKKTLSNAGIRYVFLGKELGARSDDMSCYIDGKVQFDILEKTQLFKSGIERLLEGAAKYKIAIMCAEKEPLDCHRTILVSKKLDELGCDVNHILSDGGIEGHQHVIKRLVNSLYSNNFDMFKSQDDIENEAYRRQAERIAYTLEK